MSRFGVEVRGLERLERKLKEVPGAMRDLLERASTYAEERAEDAAVPHPGRDKGVWGRGREVIKRQMSGGAVPLHASVFTRSVIAIQADEGRRPGGRRPPIRLIKVWAERHGITSSTRGGGVNKAAFRIARGMARFGSKGIGFMRKGAAATEQKLPEIVRDVARLIEERWGR